jgi:hypothetical protein
MSFSARLAMLELNWPRDDRWVYEDQCEHLRCGGTREESSLKTPRCIIMVTAGRSCLVGAGYILTMLCHVVKTWDDQGRDCFRWASVISLASGSDVTSCSNEDPSITHSFPVAYLE